MLGVVYKSYRCVSIRSPELLGEQKAEYLHITPSHVLHSKAHSVGRRRAMGT